MRFVIYAFLFIGLIHSGNIFYGPIIKNHMLEGKMIQLANESRLKADQYLMRDLRAYIEDNSIDIDADKIQIYHPTEKSVVLSANYTVHCQLFNIEKTYVFKPSSDSSTHGLIPDFTLSKYEVQPKADTPAR